MPAKVNGVLHDWQEYPKTVGLTYPVWGLQAPCWYISESLTCQQLQSQIPHQLWQTAAS